MILKEKTLSVSAIQQGTVIDHITCGQALQVIRILQLFTEKNLVTIGLNLRSHSNSLKDIVKIENVILSEMQAAQIAIFSPFATVNVIENFEVAKKFKVQMPGTIDKVLSCPNPRCVTNVETICTKFHVEETHTIVLTCAYCEKRFSKDLMHVREPS